MSFWILLSIGVVLVVAEMFSGSFFLLFVGFGFVLTGILEWLIGFENLGMNPIFIQTALICLISILSLIFIKPSIKRLLQKSEEYKEDFLDEQGEGEIKQGMVYFKGTLWSFEGDRHYDEGQKVRVKGVKNNHLILE
ncbi:hypothetical protein LS68_003420 [Helicobacter sp. MIT 05-5293]|uniref:Uncharacterized protein n=1 Tax=uncultured Helicobacter sp. TaxID=175537 RepID=A0A650EMY1_9HELI|nr:NfeD family protein [Helicobacter sp. MIT 05-5293]QGT50528.1 hypothetical protein Helico5904_2000 [uncultured Helicobacter sp.]TLD82059.1 hypothetical protein LS68_003420 [Helicobacter sp. MIT 05-5293]